MKTDQDDTPCSKPGCERVRILKPNVRRHAANANYKPRAGFITQIIAAGDKTDRSGYRFRSDDQALAYGHGDVRKVKRMPMGCLLNLDA